MRAVQLFGPKDLRSVELPDVPPPGLSDVTVRVEAVGVCGSDLHMWETGGIGGRQVTSPLCLGHEFAGTVVEVGETPMAESGTKLEIGQRVAVDPAIPCGHCENCREGNPNLCPTHIFMGVPPDPGALCERMNVPAENCFVMPDAISPGVGSLLETLGVAIHAVDLGKTAVAHSAVIFGAGPVGLLILSLLRMAGVFPVYVFEPVAGRRAKAMELGAADAWPVPDDPAQALQPLMAATRGRGCDVGFEVADAGRSVDLTFAATRSGGRVVLVGIPPLDQTKFSHAVPRRKGLTVRFARRMKHTYPRALALAERPEYAAMLHDLVTHQFNLAESPAAFELAASYRDGVIKAVVNPSQ